MTPHDETPELSLYLETHTSHQLYPLCEKLELDRNRLREQLGVLIYGIRRALCFDPEFEQSDAKTPFEVLENTLSTFKLPATDSDRDSLEDRVSSLNASLNASQQREDTLRAQLAGVVAAERERCAKVCDRQAAKQLARRLLMERDGRCPPVHENAWCDAESRRRAHTEDANAIRALPAAPKAEPVAEVTSEFGLKWLNVPAARDTLPGDKLYLSPQPDEKDGKP